MKRLTSFAIMMAMVIGLLPAAHGTEGELTLRKIPMEEVELTCEELGLQVTWYPEYEGLMRRYGTDRMLLVQGGQSYLAVLNSTEILAGPFDAVEEFDGGGQAYAAKNGRWGIIDLDGNTVMDFTYDTVHDAKERVVAKPVMEPGGWKYAIADMNGKLLTPYKYWDVHPSYSNGMLGVFIGQDKEGNDLGWGYVNEKGEEVIPCQYYRAEIGAFDENGYVILGGNLMDKTGRHLFENDFNDLWYAGCGLYGFVDDHHKVGFLDKTGNTVIEPQYYYNTSIKGGMRGNRFDEETGVAIVYLDDWDEVNGRHSVYIDTQGNRVEEGDDRLAPYAAPTLTPPHEGLRIVNDVGNSQGLGYDFGWPYGFADEDDNLVVPVMFAGVGDFDRGYAVVKVGDVFGLLRNPLFPKAREEKEPAPVDGSIWADKLSAAGDITFADVPAGSWFENGVKICAKAGIMVGTGEDTFSPNATLTEAECVMLAYRLYDQALGGDGSVLKAPENYGYMKLTTGGGFVHQGDAGDYKKWRTQYLYRDEPSGLRLCLHGLEIEVPELSLEKTVPATVTLNGEDYPGYLKWYFMGQMQPLEMVFVPEDEAANEILTSATAAEYSGHWWRDLGYTISEKGLAGSIFSLYDLDGDEATRRDFATILGRAISLPKRFDVPVIPDVKRDWATELDAVYALCEAGIVGGVDAYGTFESEKTLTRAEAAVMVARVLDESQRLTTPPKPMPAEGEGYTLTYLMDGVVADDFRWSTYPYYFVGDGEAYSAAIGLLHLDGSYYPLPVEEGGYHLSLKYYGGSEIFGEVCYHREENDDGPEMLTGILNERMEWKLPPTYGWLWPREDGYAAINGYLDERECFLLDENCQVVEQVGEKELPEWPEIVYLSDTEDDYENWGGLKIDNDYYWNKRYYRMTSYYRRSDGTPATEHFAWCGHIGPDGKGFVEKDGKIYRIQFTQP